MMARTRDRETIDFISLAMGALQRMFNMGISWTYVHSRNKKKKFILLVM